MKVALAFFGLPRRTDLTWPSIEKNLVEPLAARGSVTIYYHLYRQERVVNPRSGENHAIAPSNYNLFGQFTGVLEDPQQRLDASPLDALMAHGDAWSDGFVSFRNLLLQLYSLQAVTALAAQSDPDLVVFARPDLLYHDPMTNPDIDRVAERPQLVALPSWQWWGGHNDRFAICGRQAWRPYGNRVQMAETYCKTMLRPLHSERLLWFALYTHGIDVWPISLRASRVRASGKVEPEVFHPAPESLVLRSSLNLK